jgi:hypothetical protein
LIKNEADVVGESLAAASEWCDRIYVFDNGSTDGTWELVQGLAKCLPQIVPYKQDPVRFADGLRADIFNAFVSECRSGDWWCRLDADEFYIDDPRVFLTKVPRKFRTVWTASFEYHFTEKDVERYRQSPEEYSQVPVRQRLRFYVNYWGEMRFFRHRDGIAWDREDGGWPGSLRRARAYPVRIWVKHYQYRSPEQIERRLQTRRAAIDGGAFRHEALANWSSCLASVRTRRPGYASAAPRLAAVYWEQRIVSSSSLDFDACDRRYVVNEGLMPPIPRPRWHLRPPVPRRIRKGAEQLLKGYMRGSLALRGCRAIGLLGSIRILIRRLVRPAQPKRLDRIVK